MLIGLDQFYCTKENSKLYSFSCKRRKEVKKKGRFFSKMAKKTLTGPGLEPETSGLTYQRSYHLSYPALRWWRSQIVN